MSTELRYAVADTSFLIDWARYSGRDLLFNVFSVVFIPESVLSETRSEGTIMWIARNMAEDRFVIFTETPDVRERALELIELSRRYPVRRVDYPEAVCLAIGEGRGYIVLSENGGAYAAQFIYLRGVRVWRAFEVLLELMNRGLIGVEEFIRYQEETLHIFSRRDLERVGL